jgi:hypothetical protein
LNSSDDLDSDPLVCLNVDCFDNFAKRSLAEQANGAIWQGILVRGMGKNKGDLTALIDYVIWGDNVMTLFIIAGDLLLWCLFKIHEIRIVSITSRVEQQLRM